MTQFTFQEVKENVTPKMILWYKIFQQADRIKKLAYSIAGYSSDETILSKMDKRVDFAWSKVKELEPFPTFIAGELTDKACYYLNGIQILLLTNQIKDNES